MCWTFVTSNCKKIQTKNFGVGVFLEVEFSVLKFSDVWSKKMLKLVCFISPYNWGCSCVQTCRDKRCFGCWFDLCGSIPLRSKGGFVIHKSQTVTIQRMKFAAPNVHSPVSKIKSCNGRFWTASCFHEFVYFFCGFGFCVCNRGLPRCVKCHVV